MSHCEEDDDDGGGYAFCCLEVEQNFANLKKKNILKDVNLEDLLCREHHNHIHLRIYRMPNGAYSLPCLLH
jgi:hypothetical protein